MKRTILIFAVIFSAIVAHARTLIVYYSYTNNVHEIVTELARQIDADQLRIQPAEKDIDYAADGYAIDSALISAIRNNPESPSSYPEIDPVNVNLSDYDFIIIGAPLWWSNMAAPLQTFLFHYGPAMDGKKIGLIVSSSSSGISGVEDDARRLIPDGEFLTPSLLIRSSQTSSASSLLSEWLREIKYSEISDVHTPLVDQNIVDYTIFSVNGNLIGKNVFSLRSLRRGLYIINGKKIFVNNR